MALPSFVSKKQYIYLILIAVALFLAVIAQVRAAEPTTLGKTSEPVAKESNKVPGATTSKTSNPNAQKIALPTKLQDRIINLASNTELKLQDTNDRLTSIGDRVASRITKLKAQGVITNDAEQKLGQAKIKLVQSHSELANIVKTLETGITNGYPRQSLSDAKKQFMVVRMDLQNAHEMLMQAIALLKDAVRVAGVGKGMSGAVQNEHAATTTQSRTGSY